MKKLLVRKVTEKAQSGPLPPAIVQSHGNHVCIFPAKPKSAIAKPAAPPPKPKPEPTLEQKIEDEVAGRVSTEVGKFALGYLIGSAIDSFIHRYEK